MSTTEHTPGPWQAHGLSIHTVRTHPGSLYPGKTMCIATVNGWSGNEVVGLADARLIATAPDLLKALESVIFICERRERPPSETYTTLIENARAAIAKARGE